MLPPWNMISQKNKLIKQSCFSFLGANIFLSSDGHVKLGDFGCAVRLQKHNTMPGEISAFMGTAGKMFAWILICTSYVFSAAFESCDFNVNFYSRPPSWFPVVYIPVQTQCDFLQGTTLSTIALWGRWDTQPCTGKVQTRHEYWNFYVTMLWLDHVRASTEKFQKSWLWILPCRQKIYLFFFSQTWGTRLKYLPDGCPYMLIMQWFSDSLDVFIPKIRQNFFDFIIFMNQNKCRLHKTWSDC